MMWIISMVLFWGSPAEHPVHVAITDMVYVPETCSMQIVHKVFTDAVETHIEWLERDEVNLRLNSLWEHEQADSFLIEYLNRFFLVKAGGQILQPRFVGKEFDGESMWLYLEAENLALPDTIELIDALLIDWYDDQANFVNLFIGGQKKSLRFQKGSEHQRWDRQE